jgi:hypothetical protein
MNPKTKLKAVVIKKNREMKLPSEIKRCLSVTYDICLL